MQFNPDIHTKEFLLKDPKVLFELVAQSPEFALSSLVNDFDLLSLAGKDGFKVAHYLAEYQPKWLQSDASKAHEILRIASKRGFTVAHELARYQPEWLQSEASKAHEILRLADERGQTVAHWLAWHQPEWLQSDASKSPEILRLATDEGNTVAHYLAHIQPEWLRSEASNSPEILRLANEHGNTVAHRLAQHQPEWLQSDASKSPDILRLADKWGTTVAHYLAQHQPKWLLSEASNSPEILRLANENGLTVAFEILIYQSASVYHQPLMQKQILTLDFKGELLAEKFTEKYGDTHGLDTSTMAMKLIAQGAAYKHSQLLSLKVGNSLLKKCKFLIEDSLDAQISLKQLIALHSTFHHNVSKIISAEQQDSLQQWQDILLKSENMIRQHFNAYPELYDVEYAVDIFCEPADDLLKRLQSEWILSVEFGGLQSSISSNDIEPIKQAIY
jgi:propanediol dehydratase small subunit